VLVFVIRENIFEKAAVRLKAAGSTHETGIRKENMNNGIERINCGRYRKKSVVCRRQQWHSNNTAVRNHRETAPA
jgi:hypothetical protein